MTNLSSLPSPDLTQFADPLWLLGLLALPLLALWHHRRGVAGALTYSRLPAPARRRLGHAVGRAWSALRLHLPFYCRLAALGLLFVALARPQLGYAWEESLTEGIDVQVVLDVSGSMAAEDFQPDNRLAVARQVVGDFIAGRTGDRIGLTTFSGSAVTRSPLTTDKQMLGVLVETLEIDKVMDGTAIGVALASGAARLKDSEAESQVIILVTDGVNNTGAIDPLSAAAVCDGLGIRVYTVGVGTQGEATIPLRRQDPITGRIRVVYVQLESSLDEELLKRIAERTGGTYFRATDTDSLRLIFEEIDRLEKTEIEVKRYVRYQETFQPLAWTALGLLLLPLGTAALRLTAEP